jgi:Ca2+-transporting ATPase
VKTLQRQGMTVAMMSDGVKDAPPLKTADIGAVMGIAGTDVSKEAADMVLADDNFASIVAAVEVRRSIYASLRELLRYLLSSNIGEGMTMFFGVLLANTVGLTAAGGRLGAASRGNADSLDQPGHGRGAGPRSRSRPSECRRGDEPVAASAGRARNHWRIWGAIFFAGTVVALVTLLVLDAALPGGLIDGFGSINDVDAVAASSTPSTRAQRRKVRQWLFRNRWL